MTSVKSYMIFNQNPSADKNILFNQISSMKEEIIKANEEAMEEA